MGLITFHNHIFVSTYSGALLLARQNCHLQVVIIPDIFVENESFIFRKNDTRIRRINQATVESLSYIEQVNAKYLKSGTECSDASSSVFTRPLGLTRLSGTLLLLLVGFGCALGIVTTEACFCSSGAIVPYVMDQMGNTGVFSRHTIVPRFLRKAPEQYRAHVAI